MGRIPVNKPRVQNLKKQKEIASALFTLFMDEGFINQSTEKICEKSGKSKATLYKYFESKKEIIQFIIQDKLKAISQFSELINDEKIDHKTRYLNAVSLTISAIEGITPIFLKDVSTAYPDLFKMILELKEMSLLLLKEFYADGIKKNVFIDLSAEILVMNDDLFFTAILESDFMNSTDTNLKTLFEGYFKIRFNGILK
jgi:AcrR family transcriptional regulator